MSAIYLAIIIIILVFLVSKQLNENYNSTALVTLEHPPSGGASSPTLAYGSSSRGASRPTGEPRLRSAIETILHGSNVYFRH